MHAAKTIGRLVVSLLVISGWLAASNHCAFAATASQIAAKASAHSGCPGHDGPRHDGKTSEMECCKSFPLASAYAAKNLVSYDANLFARQFYAATSVLVPENSPNDLRPLELDTGPPFARSFVESVLQRSILAHAPPSVA